MIVPAGVAGFADTTSRIDARGAPFHRRAESVYTTRLAPAGQAAAAGPSH